MFQHKREVFFEVEECLLSLVQLAIPLTGDRGEELVLIVLFGGEGAFRGEKAVEEGGRELVDVCSEEVWVIFTAEEALVAGIEDYLC